MPRRTYDDRKGRQRPSGERINYSALLDAINSHRYGTRQSGRTKSQGDTN